MMGGHQDCPICLGDMTETDDVYPLLCPTQCGFNMCCTCVEHLITSSKDEYQEASDGNRHVKVAMNCPQCRGNLRETLEDTLLLRKARESMKYKDAPDSELKASELRCKHEFDSNRKEIQHAQLRLNKYQRDHYGGIITAEDLFFDFEQEDRTTATTTTTTTNGNKKKTNTTINTSSKTRQVPPSIDATLFSGFEHYMSEAEQEYVTMLLTSGEPSQLAQAAQILHGIFELMLEGRPPTNTTIKKSNTNNERDLLEQRAKFLRLHPLPARMPKYYNLQVYVPEEKRCMIAFEDDEWDGSIAEAFSRVHTLKRLTPGMENILAQGDTEILPSRARVKVAMVRGVAGKMGLQRGDVVTHFNGEVYLGNADDLKRRIYDLYEEDSSQTFSMVVNAEESTAEILKLRALAASNIRKAGIRRL